MSEESKGKTIGDYFDGILALIIKSIRVVLSYFGIPGLVVILGFYFIEKHATSKQKEELIDSFLLMKNSDIYFNILFYVINAFMAVMLIQHFYWKRKDRMQQERIKEMEKEKVRLQNKLFNL